MRTWEPRRRAGRSIVSCRLRSGWQPWATPSADWRSTPTPSHPGTPQMRSVQSVAIHAMGLCVLLERGAQDRRVVPVLGFRQARPAPALYWLDPPCPNGALTVQGALDADVSRRSAPVKPSTPACVRSRSAWRRSPAARSRSCDASTLSRAASSRSRAACPRSLLEKRLFDPPRTSAARSRVSAARSRPSAAPSRFSAARSRLLVVKGSATTSDAPTNVAVRLRTGLAERRSGIT
jgi:hypothetical protein